MSAPLETYALLGDLRTAALVGQDGSIDWLCVPRFDGDACFAALLGDERHGRWAITPTARVREVRRRYRPGTLVLETELETDDGAIRVVDAMPPDSPRPTIVRQVIGLRGSVEVAMDLVVRFGYGSIVPWTTRAGRRLRLVAAPDSLTLDSPVPLEGRDLRTRAGFRVGVGEQLAFSLTWAPAHEPPPPAIDPVEAIERTTTWWETWSGTSVYEGRWREPVLRSLVTIKALTYAPTGGIVAAPTTSLPEEPGGERNWDYRYCWVRDATFSLYALLLGGHVDEAREWRDWLLRVTAGHASQLNVAYGVAGERRLPELTIDWLPGYAGSRPVRIGNLAASQVQHDVIGEVLDAMHFARRSGLAPDPASWSLQRHMVEYLADHWQEPDRGIWEIRGPLRPFTHSRVMAWVAFDRAVKAVEAHSLPGPVDRWRAIRDAIHAEVCERGFSARRNAFVQAYDLDELDASLLMMPLVGFLPIDDPRVAGTIEAIERELTEDGLVRRYRAGNDVDGLTGGEGAFLPCSFWLVDCLALQGRRDEAERHFERLLGLASDVGLLSEEYGVADGRLAGNYPQAFTHVALVNTAMNLGAGRSPAAHRAEQTPGGQPPR